MVLGWVPFKIVSDSPALHLRWLLLLKIEISWIVHWGQNKRGKSAQHLTVEIPLGTKVYDLETDELIGEMVTHEQIMLVAKGDFTV